MKARTGMPDEWIANRIYDLGILDEQGPSDRGMNKYGLAATKLGGKFRSYQHGKLTGEFNTMEELQKHQMELLNNPVDEAQQKTLRILDLTENQARSYQKFCSYNN